MIRAVGWLLAFALAGACAAGPEAGPKPPEVTVAEPESVEATNPVADTGDASEPAAPAVSAEPAAPAVDLEADYDAHSKRVVPRDTFPVLDEPEMAPADGADVKDDEPVIGVVCDGEARAYPVAVMGRHELVNDVCGKTAIAASW